MCPLYIDVNEIYWYNIDSCISVNFMRSLRW